MSERDLQRIEVLTDVLAGRRTVAAAATVLAISERQMYRLLAKYENGGASALKSNSWIGALTFATAPSFLRGLRA